jgi:Rieske Fe-S protein
MATNRRGVVGWLLGTGVATSLSAFLYPVLKFVLPPETAEAAVNEATVGKVSEFKLNSGKIVKFGSTPALLVRVSETEWKAYSGVCTHLNCTVQFKEATHQIWCACHNGTYDLNGKVVSGPPPRPLEEFTVRVRGDEVVISRQA